jgi:hypothetical protein
VRLCGREKTLLSSVMDAPFVVEHNPIWKEQ